MGSKKRPADGEELNTLVASSVEKCVKVNKNKPKKNQSEWEDEDDAEQFTFKHLNIKMTMNENNLEQNRYILLYSLGWITSNKDFQ